MNQASNKPHQQILHVEVGPQKASGCPCRKRVCTSVAIKQTIYFVTFYLFISFVI